MGSVQNTQTTSQSVKCNVDQDCPANYYCDGSENICVTDSNLGVDEDRITKLDIGSVCEFNEECNTNICARTTYYGNKQCVLQSCTCTEDNTECEQGIEYSSDYNNGDLC